MGQVKLSLSLKESNELKGIALILLLIHHLFYIQDGKYDDILIGDIGIVNSLALICKVCVAIFVFLSGYALGSNLKSDLQLNVKQFYRRRFTKLFLNFWLIWLVFVPVGIIFFDRGFDKVYGSNGWLWVIPDALGLINITGRLGYNPTWWFYACIILLYIIFPAIHHVVSRWDWTIWPILLFSMILVKIPGTFLNPIRYYMLPFALGYWINALSISILPPRCEKYDLSRWRQYI